VLIKKKPQTPSQSLRAGEEDQGAELRNPLPNRNNKKGNMAELVALVLAMFLLRSRARGFKYEKELTPLYHTSNYLSIALT